MSNSTHFTYEPTLSNVLMQGDVLKRTPELEKILSTVHPHFFNNSNNTHFMVLTQSCDLILRDGEECNAPYITIAPIRSLDYILKKKLNDEAEDFPSSGSAVATDKYKSKFHEYLTRLFNNNEKGYFFLQSSPIDGLSDSCAVLRLSISLKASEHYSKCIDAKILQLRDSFQAKLGWLVGDIYSRIGTDDWPESDLKRKIKDIVNNLEVVWVPAEKSKELKKRMMEASVVLGGRAIPADQILQISSSIPDKKTKFIHRSNELIDEVLNSATEIEEVKRKLKLKLQNDPTISTLLKS